MGHFGHADGRGDASGQSARVGLAAPGCARDVGDGTDAFGLLPRLHQ